ncbi:MAG: radical SAM protein, partial [Bdellovibrionales bacterium]|nr:radical SAM protein [Bdellovibrionales bacterium]
VRHRFEDFENSPPISYLSSEVDFYQYVFPIKINQRLKWGHILATRGCPHHCSFCTHLIRESYGSIMRHKNVGTIISEIKMLSSQGVNVIAFADDDLTGDIPFLKNLCSQLIESGLNISWTAHARIDECNEEILSLMKKSGCSLIRFGLESGSEEVLSFYNKTRSPQKWWKQANSIIKICNSLDIQVLGLFILGSPKDNFKTHLHTALKAITSGLDLIQLHFYTPYEDTIVHLRSQTHKEITELDHYSWNFNNHSQSSKAMVQFFYVLIYILFYLNPFRFLKSIKNYFSFILHNMELATGLVKSYLLILTQMFRFNIKER